MHNKKNNTSKEQEYRQKATQTQEKSKNHISEETNTTNSTDAINLFVINKIALSFRFHIKASPISMLL